jgi:hypothetical protein
MSKNNRRFLKVPADDKKKAQPCQIAIQPTNSRNNNVERSPTLPGIRQRLILRTRAWLRWVTRNPIILHNREAPLAGDAI